MLLRSKEKRKSKTILENLLEIMDDKDFFKDLIKQDKLPEDVQNFMKEKIEVEFLNLEEYSLPFEENSYPPGLTLYRGTQD